MTPRVDEMTSPLIAGKFYLVPTVTYPWFGRVAAWPVIGPRHEDAAIIDFPHWHYHVDGRFLSSAAIRFIARTRPIEQIVASAPLFYHAYADHPAPIWRRLECRAAHVEYPVAPPPYWPPYWLPKLAAQYPALRRNAAGTWVCPHRGASLGSIKPDENGVITCPLHGLRWCAESGERAP